MMVNLDVVDIYQTKKKNENTPKNPKKVIENEKNALYPKFQLKEAHFLHLAFQGGRSTSALRHLRHCLHRVLHPLTV